MSVIVDHVTKTYGTQKALDDISLEIKPGEVVGLLGPNGAGKSTLMKILTCYLPPTSGNASVNGFDVLEQSMDVRRRVGYLPENNPLYLDLYVKEFLHFIAGIKHLEQKTGSSKTSQEKDATQKFNPASRIADIIALTGLGDEQHKKIGALSRGYRQRVGLAQALLHDPEVLILDEPTSGLDPNQLVDIRHLIREIGKEKTVMLSTHIMQEVESVCDRTIIIHKGKIVADEQTRNLTNLSGEKSVIQVEFDQPVKPEMLKSIDGVEKIHNTQTSPEEKETAGKHWILEAAPDQDIRPNVFQFAVSNNLTVLSMQRETQRIEEVFQVLTKG
jgi:ABC-2 type transport system ATP-binding protein